MLKYLVLLSFFGCGVQFPIDVKRTKNRRNEGMGQDRRVLKYINSFEAHYGETTKNPIVFTELEEPQAGVCYHSEDGYWTIEIDESVWNTLGDKEREVLVWHELGHCQLQRYSHNNNVKNNCPESVMRSNLFALQEIELCYNPFYQDYINELFGE